jgi:hypothetical protein
MEKKDLMGAVLTAEMIVSALELDYIRTVTEHKTYRLEMTHGQYVEFKRILVDMSRRKHDTSNS